MKDRILKELNIAKFDIEIYDNHPFGKYCVHGKSDVMWTDNLSDALVFLAEEIKPFSKPENCEFKSCILPDGYHTPGSSF